MRVEGKNVMEGIDLRVEVNYVHFMKQKKKSVRIN